jgi:hypothetical protein
MVRDSYVRFRRPVAVNLPRCVVLRRLSLHRCVGADYLVADTEAVAARLMARQTVLAALLHSLRDVASRGEWCVRVAS